MDQLLRLRGADPGYARSLPHRLERAGLSEVGAEGRLIFSHGGSPAAGVVAAAIHQVRGELAEAGLASAGEINRALSLPQDPSLIMTPPTMISAWGRNPNPDGRTPVPSPCDTTDPPCSETHAAGNNSEASSRDVGREPHVRIALDDHGHVILPALSVLPSSTGDSAGKAH
jgi:hypothetical protein